MQGLSDWKSSQLIYLDIELFGSISLTFTEYFTVSRNVSGRIKVGRHKCSKV